MYHRPLTRELVPPEVASGTAIAPEDALLSDADGLRASDPGDNAAGVVDVAGASTTSALGAKRSIFGSEMRRSRALLADVPAGPPFADTDTAGDALGARNDLRGTTIAYPALST